MPRDLTPPRRLSAALAAVMVAQALLGLLVPSAYRDPLWAYCAWHGNDFVTLLVAAPLLVWSLALSRRGSVRGHLLWLGMLGYGAYNYAYYLLGAALNAFFPLYVVLFLLSTVALVSTLAATDARAVAACFAPRVPARIVGGYLTFIGFGLVVAWSAQWAAYVFAGRTPDIGPDAFRLVAALDLSLMAPALAAGGILLIRRRPWGFLLATIAGIQGATYTLVLAVSSVIGVSNGLTGLEGQVPLWGVCTALTTLAMALLLGGVRSTPSRTAAHPSPP